VQFIVENKNRYKLSTQPTNKYLFLMFSLKNVLSTDSATNCHCISF